MAVGKAGRRFGVGRVGVGVLPSSIVLVIVLVLVLDL
jgi:hypothetical protein